MNAVRDDSRGVARRLLLGTAPTLATLSACRAEAPSRSAPEPRPAAAGQRGAVSATGDRQAGVDRPGQPQAHVVVTVYDLAPEPGTGEALARLGRVILQLATGTAPTLSAMDVGDLTVTVGIGPSLVAGTGRMMPGVVELPAFAREERTARAWGGDLLVQVCASNPVVTVLAEADLAATLAASGASRRWSQAGFRPPGSGPVRNLLGFPDGIEIPRTRADLDREVWLPGPGPATGGTIAVVRRLRIDVPGFLAQSAERQEESIGRRKADGAPLSGGGPGDQLNLSAKSPHGRYLVPAKAHARRANPNATGSGKMLRRGYSYHNGPDDQGLLFISFQRKLRTFIATQRRLDEGDDLMRFVTATASGAFLILPGFRQGLPLGSSLLDGRR